MWKRGHSDIRLHHHHLIDNLIQILGKKWFLWYWSRGLKHISFFKTYRHNWIEALSLVDISSVQFSRSVVSDSLRPHGLKYARPPCPLTAPETCSDSCPSSRWCHPTISSSIIPFPSCLLSFPASGSFPMSQLSHRVAKVLEFQLQHQSFHEYSGLISFRMDWLDLLVGQETLKSLLQHHSSKASILWCSVFFIVQFSHPHMTIGKTIALKRWTFVGKVMSLSLFFKYAV